MSFRFVSSSSSVIRNNLKAIRIPFVARPLSTTSSTSHLNTKLQVRIGRVSSNRAQFSNTVNYKNNIMATDKITSWASKDGHFRRQASQFRSFIEKGGEFPPEKGRYRLYVSLACPWAHRTLIARKLKGLEDIIDVSVVHPVMLDKGWSFYPPTEPEYAPYSKVSGVIPDPQYNVKHVRELYFKHQPDYEGRFTVPTLWDSKKEKVVSNESSEIIRMLNDAFDDLIDPKYKGLDFYPQELRSEIDQLNEWVYDTVNNGVYKSGFAATQEAYEANVKPLFASLDRLEAILKANQLQGSEYLIGGKLTEADIRLYTTIVRFDPVYVGHFKCNFGTIRADYPHINRWLLNLYWKESAFKDTTNFEHIKIHYYASHSQLNPKHIVPLGPVPDILPLEKATKL